MQLELTSADDLKKLRTNPTGKMTLVSFWATWCWSCVHEFADFGDTYRMSSMRDLRYVTVSTNMPDEKESVLRMLKNMYSTSSNLLFASEDTAALQAAFDPKWESTVPYTVLLAPGGAKLYEKLGPVDILELRRKVQENLPSDYIGFNKYWANE